MRKLKKHALLLFVLLTFCISAFLRLYRIGDVPSSIYWEEAAIGYDAYSLVQTGKDYHGNPYPVLAFTSFGDYKPPLYFYAVAPFVKILGLTDIAVRLPSAIAGILTTILVYLIASEIFGKKVGATASLLHAIQPWSMHISRVGFEVNLATFLITLGVYLLMKAMKGKHFFLPVSAGIFALSMYAYHSARIVAPVLGAFLACMYLFKGRTKKHVLWSSISLVVALLLLLPIVINIKNPVIMERAKETGIFSDISIVEESNRLKDEDGNSVFSRLVHHRYVVLIERVALQYTKDFSFSFLFLSGDENLRHQTHEFGVLYHFEFFTILLGLFYIVKKNKKLYTLPIIWILIAGIPPALTTLTPHTLRFLPASPAFAIISGFGLFELLRIIHDQKMKIIKYGLLTLTICFVLVDAYAYVHYYFTHYAYVSAREWQYGYRQLFTTLNAQRKGDQDVYVSREQGRPSMYYLYENKIDPRFVQAADKTVKKDQEELLEVGKYHFIDGVSQDSQGLFATSPSSVPTGAHILDTISLPSGESIWAIWEYKK